MSKKSKARAAAQAEFKNSVRKSMDAANNKADNLSPTLFDPLANSGKKINTTSTVKSATVAGEGSDDKTKALPTPETIANNINTDVAKENVTDGIIVGSIGNTEENDLIDNDQQKLVAVNKVTVDGIDIFTDDRLLFKVPDWGYDNFIRERTLWQKGIDSVAGEMGWFYFKIFFQFDTSTGLLGGILKPDLGNGSTDKTSTDKKFVDKYSEKNDTADDGLAPPRGDCAIRYLLMNKDHYKDVASHMEDRATALKRFVAILSYINSRAPWFFSSIDGLDKASSPDITQPLKNDQTIELGFRPDAIDMRVTTLLDLYKYAAFDYINMKEVIPQNLRQFDMTIMLFHTPIRWYHTGMQTMKRGTFQYKNFSGKDRMSYKMYTFKGCELDRDSLSAVYPSSMSNEQPFNLANAKIKIHYKRVYQHTFNEWGGFLIGDSGVYSEQEMDGSTTTIIAIQKNRLAAIQDAKDNPYYFNKSADIFKPLVDASEAKITWAMRQVLPSTVFGNLYPASSIPTSQKAYAGIYDKSTYHASTWANIAKNLWDGGYATDVNGGYYKAKLKKMKNGKLSGNPDLQGETLTGKARIESLANKTKADFESMASDISKLGTYANDSSDDQIVSGHVMSSDARIEKLRQKTEKWVKDMHDRVETCNFRDTKKESTTGDLRKSLVDKQQINNRIKSGKKTLTI